MKEPVWVYYVCWAFMAFTFAVFLWCIFTDPRVFG
jgi:hypothetical protein